MLRKKFIFDSLLNIFATAVPLIILQFIALPFVAKVIGNEQYGTVVTLISLFTLFSLPFGNVLNNIRLLINNEYKHNKISGDFNILLVASILISSLLMIFGSAFYYEEFSLINILLMLTISSLSLLKEYLIVSFRIELNFKGIFVNNILLAVGYLIGTIIFYFLKYWQSIFIVGLAFSLIYIIRNSNLLKEPFRITPLFKKTSYKSIILFCSGFLKTALSYADKLLLFPLLGPQAVSVYYTATIFGKIMSIVFSPINSVILSYLSRMNKFKMTRFIYILVILSVIGILGYFIIIAVSYPLISFLYPDWAEESLELIYITTASAVISVISSVLHPFILKFNNINWQILISGANLTLYVIFAVIFYNLYGLFGFCVGILLANTSKLILMILIFSVNSIKN